MYTLFLSLLSSAQIHDLLTRFSLFRSLRPPLPPKFTTVPHGSAFFAFFASPPSIIRNLTAIVFPRLVPLVLFCVLLFSFVVVFRSDSEYVVGTWAGGYDNKPKGCTAAEVSSAHSFEP